jgi:hypothetical protein
MLPEPRWPSSADVAWPTAELLDDLVARAGAPVRRAEAIRVRAREALDDLLAHRPGGAAWEQARAADRDRLLRAETDGRTKLADPQGVGTAVAALLADDGARYGRALAECSSVVARLDEQRSRVATDALLGATNSRIDALRGELAVAAHKAWGASHHDDRRAEAWALVEQFRATAAEAGRLVGLRRWLVGDDRAYDAETRPPVPPATYDAFTDACEELDGVPDDQRRVSRETAAALRANWRAAAEGKDLPHPEVARMQQADLAGIRPVRAGALT